MDPTIAPVPKGKARPIAARQRRGENTRRLILACATHEFSAKRYEGASMRLMARSLGMELALIQHHFGDKASLWSAVVADVIGGFRVVHSQVFAATEGQQPAARIAASIDALIHYAARNDSFVALLSQARITPTAYSESYQNELSESAAQLITLIADAQADGTFVRGDPGLLFYQLVGAAIRIFATKVDATALIGWSPTDPDMLEMHIKTCLRIFMPGQEHVSRDYMQSYTDVAAAPISETTIEESGKASAPSTFYLLMSVDSVLRKNLDEQLREIGITQSQMAALIRIADEHKLSAAKLARLLGVTAQSVTIFARALEDRGLIKRSQAKHNKRVQTIDLTPQGFEVLGKLRKIVAVAEQHLLEAITGTEQDQLRAMLTLILQQHRPMALSEWSPLLSSRRPTPSPSPSPSPDDE